MRVHVYAAACAIVESHVRSHGNVEVSLCKDLRSAIRMCVLIIVSVPVPEEGCNSFTAAQQRRCLSNVRERVLANSNT